MNEPTRLKHDPDFIAELGCDLGDEDAALGGYNLPRLREVILAEAAKPPPAPRPTRPRLRWLVTAGAVVAVATGLWVSLAAPPSPHEPVVPEPVAVPTQPPAAAAPQPPAAETPSPAPSPSTAPAQPTAASPSVEPEPVSAPELATPAPTSSLALELADFERARSFADDGSWADADLAYHHYLSAWPDGRLRAEALLGTLIARVQLGDAAGAEVLARSLAEDPALGARRDDLALVRAEALLALDRCAEAWPLVETRHDERAIAVRRACRKVRKEAP